jgi:hypothetical protein
MAPQYGAGSCSCLSWWGGSINSAFGTQTYAIQLSYPGSTSSTGGCRIAIVSPNDNAVSSTQGTLLPPNWVEVVRCHLANAFPQSRMMRGLSRSQSLS